MKKELIGVIMQAFYGNRVYMELSEQNIDNVLQGSLDSNIKPEFSSERIIIRVPNSECVIVYDGHEETLLRERIEEWKRENNKYIPHPLAFIPEEDIEIYSRCFVCRMDDRNGRFLSIQKDYFEIAYKYLAE